MVGCPLDSLGLGLACLLVDVGDVSQRERTRESENRRRGSRRRAFSRIFAGGIRRSLAFLRVLRVVDTARSLGGRVVCA